MTQPTTLQFPSPHVGRADTKILDHWHQLLFLCEEYNRKGEPYYVIRYILGDHPTMVFGPWATESQARKRFAAIEPSARLHNAFVDVEEELQEVFDANWIIEY